MRSEGEDAAKVDPWFRERWSALHSVPTPEMSGLPTGSTGTLGAKLPLLERQIGYSGSSGARERRGLDCNAHTASRMSLQVAYILLVFVSA